MQLRKILEYLLENTEFEIIRTLPFIGSMEVNPYMALY